MSNLGENKNLTLDNKVKNSKITIGNDAWIGCNVTILPGVNIADGSVVAAGSVVTKDVKPYTIVAGVLAKAIKSRFSQEQISFLIRMPGGIYLIMILKLALKTCTMLSFISKNSSTCLFTKATYLL